MNPAPSLHSAMLLAVAKKGRGERYNKQIRIIE